MSHVTIRRARGGFIVETEKPETHVTLRLSEALRIATTHLTERSFSESEVGDVIILSPVDTDTGGP